MMIIVNAIFPSATASSDDSEILKISNKTLDEGGDLEAETFRRWRMVEDQERP